MSKLFLRDVYESLKSVSGRKSYTSLPEYLKVKERIIKGKENIVNAFNSHFIAAGLTSGISNLAEHNIKGSDDLCHPTQLFTFTPILVAQVHKALINLDCKKSAGPDNIEPYCF